MIYELRVYHCSPGRLADVINRFATYTVPIFERFGITSIGYWTTLVGESNQDFYYLLQWESLADRETRWPAFQSDPEWLGVREKTEANGPIVDTISNSFLAPTAFSALK